MFGKKEVKVLKRAAILTSALCVLIGAYGPPAEARKAGEKPVEFCRKAGGNQNAVFNGNKSEVKQQGDESEIFQELLGREHEGLNAANMDRKLPFKEDMQVWNRDTNDNADFIGEQYSKLLDRSKGADGMAAMQVGKNVNLNLGNLPSTTPGLAVTPNAVLPQIPQQSQTMQVSRTVPIASPQPQRPTVPVLYPLGR